MPVLTDLAQAEVRRHVKKLFGLTLTRPQLLVSEGINPVYACDVHVSETDPTGTINQYIDEKKDLRVGKQTGSSLTGLPGQRPEDWQLDDSLPGHIDTTLRNVVIAQNNEQLIYADVGSAVVVERSESGNWQITGFSMERPGTHMLYPVDLGDLSIGPTINLSVETRLLTLAELGETDPVNRPFGSIPFGASAIYEGGVLVQIV